MELLPFPRILEVIEYTPFLELPAIGGLSINKLTETLGSLWFSTIKTFNPFFNSNSIGVPNLMEGVGPETGITDLSTCPKENVRNSNREKFIYSSFILLIFFW